MAVAPHKLEHVSISHNILIAVVTKIDTWANPGGNPVMAPTGNWEGQAIRIWFVPICQKVSSFRGDCPPPVNRPNKYILCIYLAATIHLTIN